MHIAFDHQAFTFQEFGGISRYFVRLAEALARHPDIMPSVFAPFHVNAYLNDLPPRQVVGGRRLSLSLTNMRFARFSGRLLAPLLFRAAGVDLVHETYYAANRTSPARRPIVLSVYDMIHERFASAFPSNDPTRRLKRAAVLRADHVVCISESTRRDLIEFIPEAEHKSSVTLLGFDRLKPATTNVGPRAGKPFLLYVGERGRYKNFASLLKAYATSPMLRKECDIICFGGQSFTAAERSFAADLGLSEHSLRQVDGDDDALAAHYASAAAFVYPSLYEGFGIPPLEAMALDCPVICAPVSSVPEVCGDAAEYFDPRDDDSLRTSIERLVESSDRRHQLVEKGRARLPNFSWERCADETLKVYRGLL